MTAGIWVAVGAIVVSWLIFWLGQEASKRHDLEAARALLVGVQAGMAVWGPVYFKCPYDEERIKARAQQDYDRVLRREWDVLYEIPTEPVTALVGGGATSQWIAAETINAAGVALWQMGVVNGVIRQHNDLGRQHLAEIVDTTLSPERRIVIADAAFMQSSLLHASIGQAMWYGALTKALDKDIRRLSREIANTASARLRRAWLGELPPGQQGSNATPTEDSKPVSRAEP